MGKLCWVLKHLTTLVGLRGTVQRLLATRNLAEQKKLWDNLAIVHFGESGVDLFCEGVGSLPGGQCAASRSRRS